MPFVSSRLRPIGVPSSVRSWTSAPTTGWLMVSTHPATQTEEAAPAGWAARTPATIAAEPMGGDRRRLTAPGQVEAPGALEFIVGEAANAARVGTRLSVPAGT